MVVVINIECDDETPVMLKESISTWSIAKAAICF